VINKRPNVIKRKQCVLCYSYIFLNDVLINFVLPKDLRDYDTNFYPAYLRAANALQNVLIAPLKAVTPQPFALCLEVNSGPRLARAIVKLFRRKAMEAVERAFFAHFLHPLGPHGQ
jgi:hypothetical protein